MDIDVSKARIGIMVCGLAASVLWMVQRLTENEFVLILALIATAGLVFFGWFNRCPHCGRGLYRVGFDTLHCPWCGGPL